MNHTAYWIVVASMGLFNLASMSQAQACSALAGTEPTPLVARVNAADQVFAGTILKAEDGAAVVETSTYFKGDGEAVVRIADLYLNSCSTFPEVGSEAIFFVTEFNGEFIGQYDSIFGASVPFTPENQQALQNNALIDQQLTALGMDCAAAFDGETLHVPCVKIKGSEALYTLNLALNTAAENSGEVTLTVQDVVLLQEDMTTAPPRPNEESDPSERPAEYSVRPAMVERIEFMPAETAGQVMMEVQGHLRDGCERLQPLTLELQTEYSWTFTLTAQQPTGDIACTEALVPFSERTVLVLDEMADGRYTVQINEQTAEFSLQEQALVMANPPAGSGGSDLSERPSDDVVSPAMVESLEIMIAESMPPQVTLVVTGYLRNGCETLRPLTLETQGEAGWQFSLQATQPAGDVACALALVGFEERVQLETAGLPSGRYQVQVNDKVTELMLENG